MPTPLPQLVIATRRTAKHQLKKRLPDFFSQVDDSLFALADKAESNQLQNLYFDAMREVRLKKDAMSTAFRRQLDVLFNASLDAADSSAHKTDESASLEQAGLVDDEQLEESLALTNMISGAELQNREALYGLVARMDFLIEDMEIDKDNNPLRPEVICHAFTAAVDELNGDLKVRLVIYKLFDKHIAQHLDDMYAAINADLITGGVLPRIKTPAQKSAEEKAANQPAENDIIAEIASAMSQQDANGPAATLPAGGDLFSSLQSMLSQHRAVTATVAGAPAGGVMPQGLPNGQAGAIPVAGAAMPAGMPAGGAVGGENLGGAFAGNAAGNAAGNVTGNVVGNAAGNMASNPAHGETLPAGDAQASGGVALYYAPQDIVSALSGLQTASYSAQPSNSQSGDLVDGEQSPHLAQLNPLQQAGGQPSAALIKASLVQSMGQQVGSDEDRQLGQADTDAIDIVSMLFDFILDDPHIADPFKALIARLQIPLLKVAIIDKAFFARKSHPARQLLNELAYAGAEDVDDDELDAENPSLQLVEYIVERVLNEFEDEPELFETLLTEFAQQIEEEREANRLAEEMLEQARDCVANEIRQRVEGNNVPPFIRALLIDAWKDVLNHIYLRDGGDHGTAWETALKVADELIWSVQPKLVVSERQSLTRVIPRVLNGLRDGLTLIAYDRAVTAKIFEKLEELHLASLRGGISTLQTVPDQPAENPAAAEMDDNGETTSAVQATEENAPLDEADEFIEEIILASTQAMDWDGWEQLESEYAEEVKEMAVGTWVEFLDPETDKRRRGKLAWKCDFTGDYTFVDRKYKVVADMVFTKLLKEFDNRRAFVVDDVPLFDRALDSVISGIKRAMEGKANEPENVATH